MSSTFAGVEIASRSLQTNQAVLDVIGHNIANVNTEGYTRQTAVVEATDPYTVPSATFSQPGQFGTGVALTTITQARDELMRSRLIEIQGEQGRLGEMRDDLERVQVCYGEPGKGGISSLLTSFFNGFQQLSANPEDRASRISVIQGGKTLATQFNSIASALGDLRTELEHKLTTTIDGINKSASQVADLNQQIQVSLAAGSQPNDLIDQRDKLVSSLANSIGAIVTPEMDMNGKATGAVTVSVNGFNLVQGRSATALPTSYTIAADGTAQITTPTQNITVDEGTVAGMIGSISQIDKYGADLDEVAKTLISQVNTLHSTGYGLDGNTGRAFFTGTDAATIAVSDVVASNPDAVAAAGAPLPSSTAAAGNGDNAQAIADVSSKQLFGTYTLLDYYNNKISQIGSDVSSCTSQATSRDKLAAQINTMRSSVEGVSMDEELTKMLQFQRSYQAAAKLLTVMDSLLDSLINGIGK